MPQIAALMPKPSKGKPPRTKITVFDIETINWVEAYAIALYDGKETIIHDGRDCINKFLKTFLTKKYRSNVCYAHNGGKFDFTFLLHHLVQKGWRDKYVIEPMRAGSRIIQLTIRDHHNHQWVLRDTMALLPFSLKNICETFDVTHKKGDFDHKKIHWGNWKELRPEWEPYLIDDCRGLYEAVHTYEELLIDKFNVNLRKNMTLAQLAMDVFRTNYMKEPLPTYQSREENIRKSYFGGRTEIFRLHGEDLRYYDVKSEYPYVMKHKPMPIGIPITNYDMKIDDYGIAYATVTCPDDIYIPLLPHRGENGKLLFPTGTFDGWWCTPELKKAQEIGYKVEVHWGYEFEQGNIFTEYVDAMYTIKAESKKGSPMYLISKLLMNSLYGKFGQRREREELVIFPTDTAGMEPIDFYAETEIWVKKKESQSKHILPAIASFVTSYGRLRIYEAIEEALAKGGDVYYTDTDSLVTDVELSVGGELGDLEEEIPEGIEEGIFLLPKMYALKLKNGEYVKCKGFPKMIEDDDGKKKPLFKFSMFKHALTTDDYGAFKFQQDKIATPFMSLRRNKQFLGMTKFARSVINRYDKRTVVEDFKTEPLKIECVTGS